LDLIYGVPGQSIETWKDSLNRAVSLNPKHISAYELTPEKDTILKKFLESGILSLPGEDLVLDMYDLGIDYLESAGFGHYEISNYALPVYRCIHNLNYWNRGEYLGAGAGAHSFLRGFRAMNTADINKYIEKLGSEIIPEIESVEITRDEALREFIFLGLRKTEGIRLADAGNLGLKLAEAADEMAREGMIENDDSLIRLTRKGLPIANAVIVQLLGNLGL
jgi:oxygen-independent coproporphyrinogen-3 oxidase